MLDISSFTALRVATHAAMSSPVISSILWPASLSKARGLFRPFYRVQLSEDHQAQMKWETKQFQHPAGPLSPCVTEDQGAQSVIVNLPSRG